MRKRLVVYSIKQEKARLAFGAAIHELDENPVEVIDNHSYAFKSAKSPEEIFKVLIESGFKAGEFFVFDLAGSFTGIGSAKDDLKRFFGK
jgi:hypothetical protein